MLLNVKKAYLYIIAILLFSLLSAIPIKSKCGCLEGGNILFVGVSNILKIKNYEGPFYEISLYVSGKKVEPTTDGIFDVKIDHVGEYKIEVFDSVSKQIITSQIYKAKYLPLEVSLSNVMPNISEISKNQLVAQQGLVCQSFNWDYDIVYPIQSFNIIETKDSEKIVYKTTGALFNDEQRGYINQLGSGDYLIITDIIVKVSNINNVRLHPLVYRIK